MIDRAEIERLLNQTGRTLEGLPTQDDYWYSDDYVDRNEEIGMMMYRSGFKRNEPFIMHQSDVIELLVGALRDALDKPMQKPLTLQEAIDFKDITYLEIKRKTEDGEKVYVFPIGIDETNHNFNQMTAYYVIGRGSGNYLDNHGYNVYWRCWASRPTDEERSAAAW